MDIEEIKKILWQISVEFVKKNNTMLGDYTYSDLISDIYMAARRRHIIGNLQLFVAESVNENTEATFMFSPAYLNRQPQMLFAGMGEIRWKLILPAEISREDSTEYDYEEIESEIVEKLACSKIEITHYEREDEFTKEDFIQSL